MRGASDGKEKNDQVTHAGPFHVDSQYPPMLILLLLLQLHAPWNLAEIRRQVAADPAVLEARGQDGRRPLTAAVAAGQKKAVALLLELGAKPDDPEALVLAAAAGNADLAHLLIAAKANPNAPFGDPPRSPIFWAIENNRKGMVNLLADNGTDLDKALPVVGAPLHWAAEKGPPEILLALLNPPANVRLETKDEAGYTALQRAVLANRLEAVRLLLNFGAEPLNARELAKDPAMIQLLEQPPAVKPGHREVKIRM